MNKFKGKYGVFTDQKLSLHRKSSIKEKSGISSILRSFQSICYFFRRETPFLLAGFEEKSKEKSNESVIFLMFLPLNLL